MFEPGTTLKLNVVMLIIAVGFFSYALLLAPGPEPAVSAASTPVGLPRPTSTPPATQRTDPIIGVTTRPSATPSATPTVTLTPSQTPTPTVATPTAPVLSRSPEPAEGVVEVAPTSPPLIQHTVAPGEVLSAIAARYGVTVEAIVEANRLENPNRLAVGQVLVIPRPATPTP